MRVGRATLLIFLTLTTSALSADSLKCGLAHYTASPGLTASLEQGLLVVSWTGQAGARLRSRYATSGGQPVIRDLAIKKAGAQWTILGGREATHHHGRGRVDIPALVRRGRLG